MRHLPHDDACTFVRERMELFLDGELTGSENLAFTTHLKECDECAAVWSDDEELATVLLVACQAGVGAESLASTEPAFFSADGPRTAGGARRPTEQGQAVRLRFVSRRLLALAGTAAAAVLLTWSLGGLTSPESKVDSDPVSLPIPVAKVATSSSEAGPLRVRRGHDQAWAPLNSEHRLSVGETVWAAKGTASIELEGLDGLALGLGENAVATARARGDETVFALHHGRVVADSDGAPCRLRVASVEVAIDDAACVIEATLQRETLVVLRGSVRAHFPDGDSEEVAAGRAVELTRDGSRLAPITRDRDAEIAAAEDLNQALKALRDERGRLQSEVARLRAENAALQARLEKTEANESDPEVVADSIGYLVDRFLGIVDQSNAASIDRPAPIAVQTAERLTESDGDVLAHLRMRVAEESVRLRQKALVGLIALVERPGTETLLRELCFEPVPRVRETALYCLSRLPVATPGLGAHFVRVAQGDTDATMRLRAAVYAARRGENEGARLMARIYAGSEKLESGLRRRIPMYMARLEGHLPAADRFLRGLLLDQGSDSRARSTAIRGLVERADFEAVDVLRSFAERDDVSADLRELAREAIRKLEHHY